MKTFKKEIKQRYKMNSYIIVYEFEFENTYGNRQNSGAYKLLDGISYDTFDEAKLALDKLLKDNSNLFIEKPFVKELMKSN